MTQTTLVRGSRFGISELSDGWGNGANPEEVKILVDAVITRVEVKLQEITGDEGLYWQTYTSEIIGDIGTDLNEKTVNDILEEVNCYVMNNAEEIISNGACNV